MPGDATTLPLARQPLTVERRRGPTRLALASDALARSRRRGQGALVGALALAAIVALSLFVVLMAANRPSMLSPTTHTGFFPHWMAGPLGGLLAGFTSNGTTLKYLFTGAVVLMYVGYVVAFAHAPRLPARWMIAAIVGVHAIFLLSPPLALTDVFNYINYGRMEVVHHLNPYTTIPIVEPHNDPSYRAQQLARAAQPLRAAVHAADLRRRAARRGRLLLGAEGHPRARRASATILLVWRCARLLGRDPRAAIAFVGLNPIVLVWGLGGDHNDFLMMFFIMLGFYLLLLASVRAGAGATHRAGTFDLPGTVARLRRVSLAQFARGWCRSRRWRSGRARRS